MTKLSFITFAIIILVSCRKETSNPGVVEPTSIELNESTLSLVVGGREKLLLTVTPENATLSDVKWNSSNQSIATVDDVGVITALSEGGTVITLSAGNISKKSTLQVIKSPITGLVMPDVKYPIVNNPTIFVQGNGFTASDKIWLRKIDNSTKKSTPLKSTRTGDILATILEQTAAYISFSYTASDGWYSVLLENGTAMFNLGNIQVETLQIPDYNINNNLNFWEDNYWRRFLLRGKVKHMTVTSNYSSYSRIKNYNFNGNGYLLTYSDGIDSIISTYETNNRLTSVTDYSNYKYQNSKNYSCKKYEFIYGGHNLYYPITFDEIGNSEVDYRSYWEFQGGIAMQSTESDGALWLKGITGIKKTIISNSGTTLYTYSFDVSSNTIVTIVASQTDTGNIVKVKSILTYNGSFPIKRVSYRQGQKDTTTIKYNFSSNGMPSKTELTTFSKSYTTNYVSGSPISLYLNIASCAGGYFTYEYDKNWNLVRYSILELDLDWITNFNYISYDKYGNWTQCIGYMKLGSSVYVWPITRDITYW